jgi:hypothetical protein
VQKIDADLFSALHALSSGLFRRNRRVTYPMKALLLITGFMPAFDTQVCTGMRRGGLHGMSSLTIPSQVESATWKKISRLPFLLGKCHRAHGTRLRSEIQHSSRPELKTEVGRVFDVLFFMQARNSELIVLRYSGPDRWYNFD